MNTLIAIASKHNIEYIACLPFKEKEGFSSLIVALLPYYAGEKKSYLSKYTRGEDYHRAGRKILEDILNEWGESDFEILIDVSPLNEIKLAYKAGLGCIGKNGLIINEKYGSYVFIATALIKKEYELLYPQHDECSNCGLCALKCPSGAITSNGINYSQCVSAITQKRRINSDEESAIKKCKTVWGCDICQDCCPLNKNVPLTPFENFRRNLLLDIPDIDYLSNSQFKNKYGKYALAYKGKNIIKRNIHLLGKQKD